MNPPPEIIAQSLVRMPTRQARLIALHVFDNVAPETLAAFYGATPASIERLVFRAIETLRLGQETALSEREEARCAKTLWSEASETNAWANMLRDQAPQIRDAIAALESLDAKRFTRRWESEIRWLLTLILLAAAWLLSRSRTP
jgi:hypothetical protein